MNHILSATATASPERIHHSRVREWLFRTGTFALALVPVLLLVLVGVELARGARLAFAKFGLRFFATAEWDPVNNAFGALPFIYGTLVSSLIALVIAVPVSVGSALFLSELSPRWLRGPLRTMIELLAAIPSVVLGLWGIFVMIPWLRAHVFPPLESTLSFLPLFKGPIYGPCVLAAGIMLAIMITPIITSVCHEIFAGTPALQREAAVALGATRWETIRISVLTPAKNGIIGAALLGLGRALGETMAVTMVIGNRPEIAISLFAPGHTLASALANEFAEATTDLYLSALFELGLVLVLVTICTNILARAITARAAAGKGVRLGLQIPGQTEPGVNKQ